MDENFILRNLTKKRTPSIEFDKIKNDVLGAKYSLSFVICGDALSHKLNLEMRRKDRPTNVLSFPLSKDEGEIFLNIRITEREAKKFGRSFKDHVGMLYIHGLVHLSGLDHGPKMDKLEEKYAKKYGFKN